MQLSFFVRFFLHCFSDVVNETEIPQAQPREIRQSNFPAREVMQVIHENKAGK
jgi:hypothetical protein